MDNPEVNAVEVIPTTGTPRPDFAVMDDHAILVWIAENTITADSVIAEVMRRIPEMNALLESNKSLKAVLAFLPKPKG